MPCGDASASVRFYAADASVSCGTMDCEPPFIRFCAGSKTAQNDFCDYSHDDCGDADDCVFAHVSPPFQQDTDLRFTLPGNDSDNGGSGGNHGKDNADNRLGSHSILLSHVTAVLSVSFTAGLGIDVRTDAGFSQVFRCMFQRFRLRL